MKDVFAERLKELRLERKLKQEELGKAIGVDGTAISAWELSKNIPTFDKVIKLAILFNVSLDYLGGLRDY